MRSRFITISVFSVVIAAGVFVSVRTAAAQATPPCLTLSSDLSYGNNDSYYGGPIRQLQNYLVQAGYMTATPNGHFGLGTKAAVQAFQAASGISQTGTVGPLTRAAISRQSCAVGTTAQTVTTTTTSQNSTSAATTPTTTAPPAITSPASGDIITIGKAYNISWNVPTNYSYNIILEQPGGAGAGFIATNLSGGSSFSWKGGNIFSSNTQSYQNVATGTYRIHIESSSGGVSASDPVSGWFTVTGPPLQINTLTPSSVPNDGRTVAVIYGTGFDASSIVYFDQQYGVSGTLLYASPDGTVLVFSVPTLIAPGYHSVLVGNSYGSISNIVSFMVTAATQ